MAATLDLKIRPFTDASDVRKVADEVVDALENELDKFQHYDAKEVMAMNKRTKGLITRVRELASAYDAVNNQKYVSKFASKIAKDEAAVEKLKDQIYDAKAALKSFVSTKVDEKVNSHPAAQRNVDKARADVQNAKSKIERKKADIEYTKSNIEKRKQDKALLEQNLKDAEEYYAKYHNLMDKGIFSKKGHTAFETLKSGPAGLKSATGMLDVEEKLLNKEQNELAVLEKQLEAAKSRLELQEESLQNVIEESKATAETEVMDSAEYKEAEENIRNLEQAVSDLSEELSDLHKQDAEAESKFNEGLEASKMKIAGQLSSVEDQSKGQLLQYDAKVPMAIISGIQKILPVVRQVAGGIKSAFADAFGTLKNNISIALGLVGKLKNAVFSVVKSAGGLIGGAFTKLKQMSGLLPGVSVNVKKIFQQIKRGAILVTGLILGVRGLGSILNRLRASILTGFKDIYNQDKQFKGQIDVIKQKVLDLQVAFAEAFMPIIQMAIPYIVKLLDWLMSLLGVLTRFISTITGIQAYSKAIKGLGGAAQQANKQLSKLDELNNLSSGNSNGLTPDYGGIGDPGDIEDFFDFLRRTIDEMEKMLRSIPWDEVYKKAREFGKNLAEAINIIAKPSFWAAVGSTLAKIANTIIYFFNELAKNLHFDDIGKSIFQFLWNMFNDFDIASFVETVGLWAKGIWTAIREVLTGVEQGQTLAQKFTERLIQGLQAINWDEVRAVTNDIAVTIAGFLNEMFNPELFGEAGTTFGSYIETAFQAIKNFILKFDFKGFASSIIAFINNALAEIQVADFFDALKGLVDGLLTGIETVVDEADWDTLWNDVMEVIWRTFRGVLGQKNEMGESIPTRIANVITDALNNIPWSDIEFAVFALGDTISGLINDIFSNEEFFATLGSTFGNLLANALQLASNVLGGIDFSQIGESIGTFINNVLENVDAGQFTSVISQIFNGILSTIKAVILKVDWSSVFGEIKSVLANIDWKIILAVVVPAVLKLLGGIAKTIASAFFTVFMVWLKAEFSNGTLFSTLMNIGSKIVKIFSKLGPVLSKIGPVFTKIFGYAIDSLKVIFGWVDKLLGFGETILAFLLEFVGIWQLISGIGESIALIFGKDFMGASADEWMESSPIALLLKLFTGNDFDMSAWDEVWFEFFDNIKEFWTGGEVWEDLKNIGENIINGIKEGITNFMGDNDNIFEAIFKWIFDGICNIFGIHSPAKEMESTGENIILGILEGFKLVDFTQKISEWWTTNVAPWFTLEKWTELAQPINDAITNVWNDTVEFWTESVPDWWNTNVAPWFTVQRWKELVQPIYDKITAIWTETKNWWKTNIQTWWDEYVAPWFTVEKWTTLLQVIPDAFQTAFKNAANFAIDAINNVIGAMETFINEGAFSALNELITGVNSASMGKLNIPTISGSIQLPRIPALATGAVIPPSMSEFIARLGDNNQETEIVSPLSTMKEALIEALQEVGGGSGEYHIHIDLDGREVAKAMVKQNDMYKKSTGRSLFA